MTVPMIMFIFLILSLMLNLMINMPQADKMNMKWKSQFECGFNHFSGMRPSFSIQFFMLGIMFLLFDLEISILLPCFKNEESTLVLMIFISYIFILLTFFFVLEWKNGSINWIK